MEWKYSGLIWTHQQMTTGDMDRIRSVRMGKQHLIELLEYSMSVMTVKQWSETSGHNQV